MDPITCELIPKSKHNQNNQTINDGLETKLSNQNGNKLNDKYNGNQSNNLSVLKNDKLI